MAGGILWSPPRWRSCSRRPRCDGGSPGAGLPGPGAAARHHEDTDVAVRIDDLGALREQLSEWDLWEAHNGTLRPLLSGDNLTPGCEQLWARRDAQHPWQLDLLLDRSHDQWAFKRDPRIRVPWQSALHTVDGIPYLCPELALLHKAHLDRPKDKADLAAARLDPDARAWLAHTLAQLDHHSWANAARSAMNDPHAAGPFTATLA